MNIKSLENPSGNGLFEFRIMGNQRYHDSEDFKKVAKTVIRYGVVLQAGYDKDAYNRDYAKAIMRAMGETTKVSPEEKLHKDSVGQSATLRLIDSIVTTTEDRTEMARMLKRFKASSQYQRSLKPYYGILDKLTELFHENALMGGKLGGINPVVPPQVSRLMRLSFKEAGSSLSEITSDGNDYFTSVEKRIISALAGKITMPKGIKINYDRYRDRMYLQKSEKDKLDTGLPIDPNKLKVVWEADMREVTVAYRRTLEYAKWRNQNTPDLSSPEEINDAIKTIAAFKEKYGFDPIPAVKDSVNMDQTLTDNMYVAIGVSPPLIRMFRDQGIYIGEAKISPFDKLPIMEQLKRIDKIDEKKLNAIHKKLVEKK